MARDHKGSDGGGSAEVKMNMKVDMISPLFAQKDAAEDGPAAPGGLPPWEKKDPLGIVPKGAGGKE